MIKNFIKALLKDLIREVLLEELNRQSDYMHQDPLCPLNGDNVIDYGQYYESSTTSEVGPGGYPKTFFDLWRN